MRSAVYQCGRRFRDGRWVDELGVSGTWSSFSFSSRWRIYFFRIIFGNLAGFLTNFTWERKLRKLTQWAASSDSKIRSASCWCCSAAAVGPAVRPAAVVTATVAAPFAGSRAFAGTWGSRWTFPHRHSARQTPVGCACDATRNTRPPAKSTPEWLCPASAAHRLGLSVLHLEWKDVLILI